VSATDDVMSAFRTKWAGDGALNTSIAGGPKGGDIPSPMTMPYCHIVVAQDRDPEISTGGVSVCWEKVTLTVYGLYAAANTIVGQIAAVFEGAYPGGARTLTVPNSTHMCTLPVDPGRLEKCDERKDGEEIWKGIVEYVVMLQRSSP
jgi:hypothetical protein